MTPPMNPLLKISGPDATTFLQGQLTCDIGKMTASQCHLALHCNREGRIISLFNIFLYQHDYYLFMPESMIPITLTALKKYAIFSKVSLDVLRTHAIPIPTIPYPQLPAIYPETSGQFLPHELSLQKTDAISFNKGCYTGQEIIARIHYRAKLKKQLYQAHLATNVPQTRGAPLYYENNGLLEIGGVLVDAISLKPNDQTIWLVSEEAHAIEEHLFLKDQDSDSAIATTMLAEIKPIVFNVSQ
ncbi:MAG: hypothetical protein A3F43_04260 [Gammaproteobacteria bacterium RIFCSPHIGHO2_12_FULL_42_10]|nr:MAG: hypothetical protein A3F43_04260 [Gammaproteobacteria bacterium RIFCSPHIGHO2_12_FULL_42_10]